MSDQEAADEDDVTIQHIKRISLPWNTADLTQCGLPLDNLRLSALTRDEFNARLKKLGERRTAMTTCLTCYDTLKRYPNTWEENPISAMEREISSGGGAWGHRIHSVGDGYGGGKRAERTRDLARQLFAIAKLVEQHRPEFDELIADQRETVSLDAERKARDVSSRRGPGRR